MQKQLNKFQVDVNKTLSLQYEAFTFSGGERQVRILSGLPAVSISEVLITAFLKSSEDVMELLLLCDAIKRHRKTDKDLTLKIKIPYFPYARQDRVCNEGEALGVKVMAQLINSIGATEVLVQDPHSDVVTALLDNCYVPPLDIMLLTAVPAFFRDHNTVLVAPDAGASKKVFELGKKLGMPVLQAHKQRNTANGEITGVVLEPNPFADGRKYLIVDDICDGGRTFVELAKVIHNDLKPNCIALYVTHGIFSKGLSVFDKLIDKVFAYNVWEENIESKFLVNRETLDNQKTWK